jgi:uncharacterized integral membrane protein
MLRKLFSTFVVLPLGLLLVVFAVINRHAVTVSLDPFGGNSPALTATMPLFLLILGLLGLGVLAGGVMTWLGQGRWRRASRRLGSEVRELRAERDALRAELAAAQETRALPPSVASS